MEPRDRQTANEWTTREGLEEGGGFWVGHWSRCWEVVGEPEWTQRAAFLLRLGRCQSERNSRRNEDEKGEKKGFTRANEPPLVTGSMGAPLCSIDAKAEMAAVASLRLVDGRARARVERAAPRGSGPGAGGPRWTRPTHPREAKGETTAQRRCRDRVVRTNERCDSACGTWRPPPT